MDYTELRERLRTTLARSKRANGVSLGLYGTDGNGHRVTLPDTDTRYGYVRSYVLFPDNTVGRYWFDAWGGGRWRCNGYTTLARARMFPR